MSKVYIISQRILKRQYFNDGIVLTEQDFNPMQSFWKNHPNITPESFDYIYIRGILEDFIYIRCVLKNVLWMMSVGAKLEIDVFVCRLGGNGYAIRPKDDIACEISTVFGDKVILKSCSDGICQKRIYQKTKSVLADGDRIDKWSFGIVSDGRKNRRILDIISRIKQFNIPFYEILICGPSPSDKEIPNVRVIDDSAFYKDIRTPICSKKNEIIRQAKYENIVLIHDRIIFSESWYQDILQHGNYFDVIIPAILDENDSTKHVVDAPHFNYVMFGQHPKPSYRPYWSPTLYMDGAIMIIKRMLAMEYLLNENLYWGEKEDVDFAKRLYLGGGYIEIDHSVKVNTMTSNKRYGSADIPKISAIIRRPLSYPKWLVDFCKEKFKFYKYLHNWK